MTLSHLFLDMAGVVDGEGHDSFFLWRRRGLRRAFCRLFPWRRPVSILRRSSRPPGEKPIERMRNRRAVFRKQPQEAAACSNAAVACI